VKMTVVVVVEGTVVVWDSVVVVDGTGASS